MYSLDPYPKEKVSLFVEDLTILLNYHWVHDKEIFTHKRLQVQLTVNLILAGTTATQPGVLIRQLLYKHLKFQLFPPLTGEERP
jgi:hypothetical protein